MRSERTPESSKSQGRGLFLFCFFCLIAPIHSSDALGGVSGNVSSIGHEIWSEAVRKNKDLGMEFLSPSWIHVQTEMKL